MIIARNTSVCYRNVIENTDPWCEASFTELIYGNREDALKIELLIHINEIISFKSKQNMKFHFSKKISDISLDL